MTYRLQVAKSLSVMCAAQPTTELVLQSRKKWRKLFKMINVQPLSGGGILLKFSWYSQYTNSTNIWAIIQLNPSKKKSSWIFDVEDCTFLFQSPREITVVHGKSFHLGTSQICSAPGKRQFFSSVFFFYLLFFLPSTFYLPTSGLK